MTIATPLVLKLKEPMEDAPSAEIPAIFTKLRRLMPFCSPGDFRFPLLSIFNFLLPVVETRPDRILPGQPRCGRTRPSPRSASFQGPLDRLAVRTLPILSNITQVLRFYQTSAYS